MIWLLRKTLIPAAAFVFGWFAHAEFVSERCTAAGGSVTGLICRGVAE